MNSAGFSSKNLQMFVQKFSIIYNSGNSALYVHYYIFLHLAFCNVNMFTQKSINAKEIENISVYSY